MNTTLSSWELNAIDLQLIDLAFIEDLGQPYCDLTTAILFPTLNENARAIPVSYTHLTLPTKA